MERIFKVSPVGIVQKHSYIHQPDPDFKKYQVRVNFRKEDIKDILDFVNNNKEMFIEQFNVPINEDCNYDANYKIKYKWDKDNNCMTDEETGNIEICFRSNYAPKMYDNTKQVIELRELEPGTKVRVNYEIKANFQKKQRNQIAHVVIISYKLYAIQVIEDKHNGENKVERCPF